MKTLSALLFFVVCCFSFGQGQLTVMPKRGHIQALEVRKIDVAVELDDHTALTTVTHTFFNRGRRWQEGRFLFPLPKDAVVEDFTMWIGGREMPAELLDADKARKIYEDIVRSMKDPALLEFQDNGMLSLRVFPIEAGQEKVVKLAFRQSLKRTASLRQWRWPMTFASLDNAAIGQFKLDARVHSRDALNTLYVPTHDCRIERSGKTGRVSFQASQFQPKNDLEILFSTGHKGYGLDLLTQKDGDDTFFWMTLVPDMKAKAPVVARDIVFVVDSSGSMAGPKMDQAKAALRYCVANLNDGDRFQIIRFGTTAEAFAKDWHAVDKPSREAAYRYINQLSARGGTNMEEALSLAMALPKSDRQRTVLLLSDGKPTIGTTQEADLVALLDKTNLRVHPVGIGYKINTHLLDQISNQSGGSNVYVAPEEDLELKLAQFYEQIKEPLLVNLDLSFEGVTVSDLHPRKLPDLYRGQALHVFGRYSGSGTARVTLKGAMNAKAVEQSYRLRFKESRDHAFITKLWAKRRVGWLLDQIRLNGSDPELVEEVRQLGARFDILTPYNSRLILEDEATRPQSVVSSDVLERLPTGRAVDSLMTTMPKEKSGRAAFTTSVQIQSYEDALTVDEEASGVKKEDRPKTIDNRHFEWRDGGWYETILDRVRTSAREEVPFASSRYFELATIPELRKILALGKKVDFLHEGTIIAIR